MSTAVSAFTLSVHQSARHMPHASFRPWLFQEMQRYLRFDSAMWVRMVMGPGVVHTYDHYLDRQRPDRITAYMEQELWRDDPFMKVLMQSGPTGAVLMSASILPPGRQRDYLELHEQRHMVAAFEVNPSVGSCAGFGFFRKGLDDVFSEDERRFVEAVEPHLRDAWTQNWLRELGAAQPDELHADFAQAVFTAEHVLSAADDAFIPMVRREWPDWQGPFQPAAWATQLAQPQGESAWSGRVLQAYFRRMQDARVLVCVRALHALDRLSPRKREVALLFARGALQSDVARRLQLSPSTVNNYLVDVYRELGVSDKTGLAVLAARLLPAAERRIQ